MPPTAGASAPTTTASPSERSAGARRVPARFAASPSPTLVVAALTGVALLVRAALTAGGGLWRDEALLLFVVRLPSWGAMLDFLRQQESHPPLFYVLMRLWVAVAGGSETAALALPVLLGAAIVPALYWVGTALSSRRAGLTAAALGAASPMLAEHAAVVRPYSLLPLLGVLSCYALIRAVERGGRAWAGYVLSTLAMLYTHNWAWLVLGAQWVAVAVILVRGGGARGRAALVREGAAAQLVIAAAYAPWLPTMLYQAQHAGHGGARLHEFGGLGGFLWESLYLVRTTLLLPAASPDNALAMRVVKIALVLLLGAALVLQFRRRAGAGAAAGPARVAPAGTMIVLLVVPVAATAAALVISLRSNLLWARCLVMLTPLPLLAVAYWLDRMRATVPRWLPLGAIAALLVLDALGTRQLLGSGKSNARELAGHVSSRTEPSDLVVIAPEWLASSFNWYYDQPVEQIDFPVMGRQGATSFADVYARMHDPRAMARARDRIAQARAAGARVWLVTELEGASEGPVTTDGSARAGHDVGSRIDEDVARELFDHMQSLYGAPDFISQAPDPKPRYETFTAFLFTPVQSP